MKRIPPYVLAIDLASKTGIAEGFLGDVPTLSSVTLGDADINHANMAKRADIFFTNKFKEYKDLNIIPYIFIEKPIAGFAVKGHSNQAATEVLIGFYWIAMARCMSFGVMPTAVPIQSWKPKFMGKGAGKLKRKDAKELSFKVATELGWNPKSDDESDAAGIYYYAGLQLAPKLMPPVHPLFLAGKVKVVA